MRTLQLDGLELEIQDLFEEKIARYLGYEDVSDLTDEDVKRVVLELAMREAPALEFIESPIHE